MFRGSSLLAAGVAVLVTAASVGVGVVSSDVEAGPRVSAEAVALGEARADVVRVFPGVDPVDASALLEGLRTAFVGVGRVEVLTTTKAVSAVSAMEPRSSPTGSPTGSPTSGAATDPVSESSERVVLSASGVYTKTVASDGALETVVSDGESGWVRGTELFWVGRGMEPAAAERAAGVWVATDAIAEEGQTLPGVRGALATQFEREWGSGVGDVRLIEFEGVPALLVETGHGRVVAVGDPLLPVESVFEGVSGEVRMRFRYEGVQPVKVPVGAVSLDDVVYD